MTSWRRLAVVGVTCAVAMLVGGCTSEPSATSEDAEAQTLTVEERFFLNDLNRRGVGVEEREALNFIGWYCQNLVASNDDIEQQTTATGVAGADDTNEMLNAANSACRSSGPSTGG